MRILPHWDGTEKHWNVGPVLDVKLKWGGDDISAAHLRPEEFVNWITDHATDEQILALRERIMRS
jgi:hypothetical protein